jgi:hypothetical protein
MRRSIAAAAAAIAITGAMTLTAVPAQAAAVARAAPAAQGPGGPQDQLWCLKNRPVACIGFDPYQTVEAISAAVVAAKVLIDWISQGRSSNGDSKGEEKNEGTEDGAGGDNNAGLCLADLGGSNAYWAPCNAAGTTFIDVPAGGGAYYLESQYELNRGWDGAVLSTGTGNLTSLYLDPWGTSGFWQKWAWDAPVQR